MKYLSKYKLFENFEETKKELEEICYDLTDYGFEILIRPDNFVTTFSKNHSILEIRKNREIKYFKFGEIEDAVYRIEDFLGERLVQASFKREPRANYRDFPFVICDIDRIKKEIINDHDIVKVGDYYMIFSNE